MKKILKMRRRILALLLIITVMFTSVQITPINANAQTVSQIADNIRYSGNGFDVYFKITSSWEGAFIANVTLTNTGNKLIENWALGFTMPYKINDIWDSTVKSYENGIYTIKNIGYNQDIAPGQSVTFGFRAECREEISLPKSFDLLCQEVEVSKEQVEISSDISGDWVQGFQGNIRIKNISDSVIEDWKLYFDFDYNIDEFWTASIIKREGSHYYIKNAGYNSNIKPGETLTLGFGGHPGNVKTNITGYRLMQIITKSPVEYVELKDGKIEKRYLHRAIYPRLMMDNKPIDDVRLADDFDGDGLSLAEEYKYDTNPFLKDSDEDGLDDKEEIFTYKTNPNYWDSDDDQMSDGTEVSCGLNPLQKDTDGNGVSDNEENMQQQVRLDGYEHHELSEVGTLPNVVITGKGDFSRKIQAVKVEHNRTILDINCLVGTAFDFMHKEELKFDSSTLTFLVSDDILKNNQLNDLAVAYFNEEDNGLELLDTRYDYANNSISADVRHFSTYMVVNRLTYLHDIDWKNKGSVIKSDKADIVFAIDTTGSMSEAIHNTRDNVGKFVAKLADNKVDVRLGLVEFKDIYDDGKESTKGYGWCTDVKVFKTRLNSLDVGGGGDSPESAVDALHYAEGMKFRSGVKKYIILITDEEYKNGIVGNHSFTMQDEINSLKTKGIVVSVITDTAHYNIYRGLTISTDGILGSLSENFVTALEPLINRMKEQVNTGCRVRLHDGSTVKLDKDPALKDETVDTDKDGIPDIYELKNKYTIREYVPEVHDYVLLERWYYSSNPIKKDTDGDGIEDADDLTPTVYTTTITVNNDDRIEFNTKNTWHKINCTAFEYLDNLAAILNKNVVATIPPEKFRKIMANVDLNDRIAFSVQELAVIGLFNNEGSKLYMNKFSSNIREAVFERLAGRPSDNYWHNSVLSWEKWEKVPKSWKGGFLTGTVLSEADINFSTKIYYTFDMYNVLNVIAKAGALVIAAFVVYKAAPVVLAHIQAINYYVKTFGVTQGLKMYTYLGTGNLPDGVLSWVQADAADGDSSLDDLVDSGIPIYKRGETGEQFLKERFGGESQKYFKTWVNGVEKGRFVDQFANRIAHESKVGYTCLNERVREQILKDAYLLQEKTATKVIWHFFRSGITGQLGASKQLLNFLTEHGIEYMFHE